MICLIHWHYPNPLHQICFLSGSGWYNLVLRFSIWLIGSSTLIEQSGRLLTLATCHYCLVLCLCLYVDVLWCRVGWTSTSGGWHKWLLMRNCLLVIGSCYRIPLTLGAIRYVHVWCIDVLASIQPFKTALWQWYFLVIVDASKGGWFWTKDHSWNTRRKFCNAGSVVDIVMCISDTAWKLFYTCDQVCKNHT